MGTTLAGTTVVVASRDQVSCNLGQEIALLSLKNSVYYGLDEVGSFIWSRLQKPCSIDALRDSVVEVYEVEPERCERDLRELLEKLLAEGLVEIANGSAA